MASWRRFRALGWADRRLLGEAAVRLLLAWCLLRLRPFMRVVATLDRARPGAGGAHDEIRRVRWAVEAAARHLPLDLSCLPQALAASWMLIARGARPSLYFGVAAAGRGFESHAWVEVDGVPVVGHRVAVGFTPLAVFPRDAIPSANRARSR